jgi:methyl-accepting chemotaxis protein
MERLATNNGLQAPAPADSAVLAEIEKRRKGVKANFDTGLAGLKGRDFPNKQKLMGDLDGALQKANDYRTRADAALKLPRDQRDETLRTTFIPVITDSVNAALKVWFAALYSTAKSDATLARLASLKELGWRMRDISGAERSNVASAIAAGTAIPANQVAANADIRSRVDLLWQQLQNLTQDADTHPAVLEAMRAAQEHYFRNFRALSDEMRKIGEAGAKYPTTAPQFVDTTTPQIGKLLDVLYGASKASEEFTSAAIDRSIREMVVITILILVGIGIAIACIWATRVRVTRPLAALASAMTELSSGNTDAKLPEIRYHDEIGEMVKAVAVFRDAGVEKARIEGEAAEQRQVSEEERARNDAARAQADKEQAFVVDSLAGGLERIARGDLSHQLTQTFPPEYRKLQSDFNAAVAKLQETISAIAASAREVAGASGEISGGTTDLSQRTEEQAASLEQTSSAMERISATVKKNADSAQQAKQFTDGTREVADRGGAVVAEAVSAMARIAESSSKISDIISVIDEIARQTNLLALNAAVEAARAGEAGRGFAVVASEVRSLAQRSSQAAKDIKDLITNSSGQVQEGVELVNKAGGSLTEILESIKKVAEIVSDIAGASAEQSTGIDQVKMSLAQMDEVTQQNSALVEENAAAAKALEQQSRAMDEQVNFFQLGEDQAPVPSQAVQRPAQMRRAVA